MKRADALRFIGTAMDLIGPHRLRGCASHRLDYKTGPSWHFPLLDNDQAWKHLPGTVVKDGVVEIHSPEEFLNWCVSRSIIEQGEVPYFLALYTLRLTGEYPPYSGYGASD